MADNEKEAHDKGPATTDAATTEHGKTSDRDTQAKENAANTVDKHARGNLGGRNPSQPQTSMGDRDPKGEDRGQPDITDPMTSRDPSKINQKPAQQ
jgi:hypothetical protein